MHALALWLTSRPRGSLALVLLPAQLKKMLSANSEALLNIECIMEDVDVRSKLSRDELEEICQPVFSRLKAPMEQVRGGQIRGAGPDPGSSTEGSEQRREGRAEKEMREKEGREGAGGKQGLGGALPPGQARHFCATPCVPSSSLSTSPRPPCVHAGPG